MMTMKIRIATRTASPPTREGSRKAIRIHSCFTLSHRKKSSSFTAAYPNERRQTMPTLVIKYQSARHPSSSSGPPTSTAPSQNMGLAHHGRPGSIGAGEKAGRFAIKFHSRFDPPTR